jgi:hypothetical protein
MENKIIELVGNCKLIEERGVKNGHDCWGKLEWTTELYAYVNGKSKRVFEGMYVIHDGKIIEDVVYDWQLKDYQDKKQKQSEEFEAKLEQPKDESQEELWKELWTYFITNDFDSAESVFKLIKK